ncbi:MAG: aldo/keto reductase [Bacteroidales bacterium]|nr:aldo/keto reductase [Bacteroidales bacterium]
MKKKSKSRRQFIRSTGLSILGAGLLDHENVAAHNCDHQDDSPKVKNYRRLGRTGAMVSDIGSGEPTSSSVLKAVLDSGVNFIETSESYGNGRNEILIGNVIKNFEREKLFIATKAFPAMKIFKSSDDVLQRAEGSLRRLQTDYIDLYMVHQAQNIFRVKDDYFHKAAEILKKQGKIRFTGLSCHGPEWGPESHENLEDILMAAIDDGRFDVLLLPYNFLSPEMGERILRACKEHDIGTMIMKSNPILAYENYTSLMESGNELERTEQKYYEGLLEAMQEADSFFKKYKMNDMEQLKDGAIQFILTNPDVHTICCRFRTFPDVNKYVRLSGTTLDNRIAQIMNDFRDSLGFLNCRIGCNICEKECPHQVPVNTIMRYNYYFHSHRMEKTAMQYYQDLPGEKAGSCIDCEGYCEKACPHGVVPQFLLARIHEDLSFNTRDMKT